MSSDPNFSIRDVAPGDLERVHRINQAHVPAVGSIDFAQMKWFSLHAAYFRVTVNDDRIAAFLIGMRPGSTYQSENYLWFSEHYEDFGYIDRIAVIEDARRFGLATRMYQDFEASLPDSVEVITCEVNVRPPNESSMRFHERYGFRQVGTQQTEGGSKQVALLEKKR